MGRDMRFDPVFYGYPVFPGTRADASLHRRQRDTGREDRALLRQVNACMAGGASEADTSLARKDSLAMASKENVSNVLFYIFA